MIQKKNRNFQRLKKEKKLRKSGFIYISCLTIKDRVGFTTGFDDE